MTTTTKYVALRLMSDRISDTVSEYGYAAALAASKSAFGLSGAEYWYLRKDRMRRRYRRQMKALLRIASAEVSS